MPVDHPFCAEISYLANQGRINGYPDGGFHPTASLSRQAFAAISSQDYEFVEECLEAPSTDVPVDHPFCAEIQQVSSMGIANGYPNGSFQPTAPVSRQALAAFLVRQIEAFSGSPLNLEACHGDVFTDIGMSHPFCKEIEFLASNGIIGGYADGTFKGSNRVSRQAYAAFAVRVQQYLNW